MDVYILPKHIWGKMSPAERDKYEGEDGVGSGPFVLEKFERGQFARFKANPNYWGGKPAVDKVVLRKFNNPDAMVAALKTGELDAAWNIPGAAFLELKKDPNIVTNEGYQGAFAEVAINGGDGLEKPHPALLDPEVRKAIAHAIDKDTLVDRVLAGMGKPAETMSPPPTRAGYRSSARIRSTSSTSTRRARSSKRRATRTPTTTGCARCPAVGSPLNFRYCARSDGETGAEIAEFITAWLDEIGIATTVKVVDDSQLTNDHRQGRVRHVRLGLDAVRGPGHDALLHDLRPGRARSRGSRPTTTTTPTTATRSTTASTSSRRSSSIPRSAGRSSTRC